MTRHPVDGYRALFILNSLGFGGAEKHVVSLLNRLDATRNELALAWLANDTTLLPQIDRSRLTASFHAGVARKLDWAAAGRLARHIDEHETDIVVCTNLSSLLYGWMARLRAKRKPRLVEVFHSTILTTRAERLKMALFRPLFRAADMVVYVCENQKAYWSAKGLRARAARVIHNGIDIEHFQDCYDAAEKTALRQRCGLSDDDRVVGMCANMRPEKAHGDLLAALAQLKARGVRCKALLIGDGVERARIEQQIDRLDLRDDVRITGFVEDVRPLLSICDIVAITSHTETFSIAALEAMALGRPMVMTDTGGAAEQVSPGHNGYLYPVGDIAALATALENSMQPGKCSALGANARAVVVGRFSLPVMTQAFEQLFCMLVRRDT